MAIRVVDEYSFEEVVEISKVVDLRELKDRRAELARIAEDELAKLDELIDAAEAAGVTERPIGVRDEESPEEGVL